MQIHYDSCLVFHLLPYQPLLYFCVSSFFEAPRTSRNKFHDWLEKTIEETTETKDNNPETIELRVFKNE